MKNSYLVYLIAFSVLMNLYPVSYSVTRNLSLILYPIIFLSLTYRFLKLRLFIASTLCVSLLIIVTLLRQENLDRTSIVESYQKNLLSYEGTSYYWGGENFIGIDCSGLARKALFNALIEEGAFKTAFNLWYFDASAKALMEGYRQQTVDVTTAKSINALDHSQIKIGDLAITVNGVHVMVYLGDNEWIEADPELTKVIRVKAPKQGFGWFDIPIKVKRWTLLNDS